MRRNKKLVSKIVAVTMAAALTFTSGFGGFNISAKAETMTAETTVTKDTQQALAVTKTQNADTFSWDNATVYFLLTDRFVNGDTSNDHSYNRGCDENGNVVSGMDERATFHGGDFKGLTSKIEEGYFDDLGINAIWLSAPYEQIHGYLTGGDTTPTFAHYAYHGYYVLDYTQTDANFGTEEEFQTLVDTAHKHGIRVIMDIVLNHAGYNSMYDMNEYGFGGLADGWKDVYYGNMTNVLSKEYHGHILYNSESGNDSALAAKWANWWGSDWIRAGLEGYSSGEGNDATTTPVAGLPDFKTESTTTVDIPNLLKTKWTKEGTLSAKTSEVKNWLSSNGYSQTVNNYVCYWLSSWVRKYGVDGFRCDTAKHVRPQEWAVLSDMCTQALKDWKAANPSKALDDAEFWMTGECWDHAIGSKDSYYTVGKFDSMINFATCGGGALASGKIDGVYNYYAENINSDPEYNQLSFISSHDEVLAKSSQNMYDMGSAFLLLPGGVQIYYGDESGRDLVSGVTFDGGGGSGQCLRSDMNWDTMDEELLAHWQKVGTFRKNHIAVGAGSNISLTATSGTGFGRTYSKGSISDRVAGVVYASANTDVTIDVSSLWADGETVINYYDGSAYQVTGGKVTFNSGAHGTILIADKGDKPIVSISGAAKFKGTQQVTVNVEQADYAIISIDGGHSQKVTNGTKLTIGSTAYERDNVVISYSASNAKGSVTGKKTFYKAYADEDISEGGGEVVTTPAKIHVKMADGSAPLVYGWTGTNSNFTEAWPGDTFSAKDSEGYYVGEYNSVTGSYNLVIHNSSNSVKTADITGLKGEVWIDVTASSGYDVKGDTVVVEDESDIVIHVTALPNGTAPYLYVWDSANKACNGGFPGNQLTEKDSDGNYVLTFKAKPAVNCIVSGGSNQNQSGNLTGITAEAWITINSNDCSDVKMTKQDAVESKFTKMKQLARKSLIYTSTDYTSSTWTSFKNVAASAKTLIDQGEKDADTTAVNNMYDSLVTAESALVLATPKITASTIGTRTISGTAVKGAKVTVVYSGKTYTAIADELTGKWSVTTSASLASGTFKVKAEWNGKSSANESKTVGVVDGSEVIVTEAKPVISSITAGDKKITVKWGSIEGATNYRVFTYLNGSYTKIGDTTSTSYTISGLKNGTKYGVLVKACVNGTWVVSDTDHIKYATPAASTSTNTKPVISSITAGDKKITVKWGAITGATNYRVFTYLNSKYTKIGDTTSTSYTISGLKNGTKYGVLVKACINGSWVVSDADHIKYATPAASTSTNTKPVISSITAGDKKITVKWGAITGATNYRVFTYLNGSYTKIGDTTSTSYTITGLKNGTKYGVLVKACINGAWVVSDADHIKYATPAASTSTNTKPVISSITAGDKKITVKWGEISGATNYRVFTYVNGDYTKIGDTTSTTYTISNLVNGINYGVLVKACINGSWVVSDADHIKYATPA